MSIDNRPRLQKKFFDEVLYLYKDDNKCKSIMQVPRLVKICINQGIGEAVMNKKFVDEAISNISLISGQKAIPVKARKAISNFKLRKGMNIGVMVTLRGKIMYEFLDRLITIILPRVRDFDGISPKSFDGHGNYSLGIKEQIIFPEINIDKVSKIMGMNIALVTSTNKDEEAYKMLSLLGVPFKK